MKYFVVSDVHSHDRVLKETLAAHGFSEQGDDVLVLLGDAFDRGDGACALAEYLLSLHDRGRLIYVRGNHEDLLIRCLQQLASGDDPLEIATSYHARNGTWQTLLALGGMTEQQAVSYPQMLVSAVMGTRVYRDLLPSCVDYYETDRYVFVHGYLPCIQRGLFTSVRYSYDPNWREATEDEWYRARWYNGGLVAVEHGVREPQKTVVFGHWHTSSYHSKYKGRGSEWGEDADFSVFCDEHAGVMGLDACVTVSGRLNCFVYEE